MADRDALLVLADRVEREPPSQELDDAIGRAMLHTRLPGNAPPYQHYTTSLDAAVTLVPASHAWRVGSGGWADVHVRFKRWDGAADTPAAALTAAALRAIAAQETT